MGINVFNEDCLPYMRKCKNNQFDLAIVDPPYGINVGLRVYSNEKKGTYLWDKEPPKQEYFEQLKRISKNQIIWGGNYFLRYLDSTNCFIVWDKKMTEKHKMPMAEFAWTSFNSKSLIFRQPPPGDRGFYNIDGARIHPTQKSIKLYKWLLTNYAKPGQTILDTHFGSGSIAIACHDLGFDLTAFEIDKEYYQAAMKRLRTHQAQLQLFKD